MKLNKEQIDKLKNHKFNATLKNLCNQLMIERLIELDKEFFDDVAEKYIEFYKDK